MGAGNPVRSASQIFVCFARMSCYTLRLRRRLSALAVYGTRPSGLVCQWQKPLCASERRLAASSIFVHLINNAFDLHVFRP